MPERPDFPELVTTTEAASFVGVSPVTIRGWAHRGWLRPADRRRIGGRHRVLYRLADVYAVDAECLQVPCTATRRVALG